MGKGRKGKDGERAKGRWEKGEWLREGKGEWVRVGERGRVGKGGKVKGEEKG